MKELTCYFESKGETETIIFGQACQSFMASFQALQDSHIAVF
jgi:hypothetical protein